MSRQIDIIVDWINFIYRRTLEIKNRLLLGGYDCIEKTPS